MRIVSSPKMPPATPTTAAKTVRPTASTPAGAGRGLDRLLEREMFPQQSFRDQELLHLLEHLVLDAPELLRLVDERRHDERHDEAERAEDREIEDEDRQPARKALRPDRQQLLPLDQADDRAEPDREQAADVEEQQHVADQVRRPQQDAGERGHPDGPEDQRFVAVRVGCPCRRTREVSGGPGQGVECGPSGRARNSAVNCADEVVDLGELRRARPGTRRGRSRPPASCRSPIRRRTARRWRAAAPST